ncbi:MAG: nuclear transport factor 2 family protein [Actinomycetota bacterium]|nr:nuclear transport factor 2 family protein [Actinomycetota bacterium]
MDDDKKRADLLRHWEYSGRDEAVAHEIYHEDVVLEFPQSGERFVGVNNIQPWRASYPAKLDFEVRQIRGGGDFWVAENAISYDGGPWNFTVSILEFRGDKVARETIYIMEKWEAAEWREPWWDRPPNRWDAPRTRSRTS